MESIDSPEIPDRGETSDIPGLPFRRERVRETERERETEAEPEREGGREREREIYIVGF